MNFINKVLLFYNIIVGESDDNDDTLSMLSENTKNRKKKKKFDEKKL